jgi:hypothetical protein
MQNLETLKQEYNKLVDTPLPYNLGRNAVKEAIKERNKKLREIEPLIAQQLPLKVGDFFYESWGYDQTNIDYLEVMEISPTRKTVMCRMVGKLRDTTEQFSTSDKVTPDNSYRGPTLFRMKVSAFRDGVTLRGEYPFSEHYFLACKLADQHKQQGVFKCPKYADSNNYELSNYFMWSNGARENRCKDCEQCHNELSVSWRSGSFSKYDHPMYETDPMFGH